MKKRMKKIISLVLVLSLLISTLPLVFGVSGDIDPEIIKETSQTAVNVEAEGIVLLKNEDNKKPEEFDYSKYSLIETPMEIRGLYHPNLPDR